MPRTTRHRSKAGKKPHGTRRRGARKGGNAEKAVKDVAKDFGLVKRNYGDIVRKFLDDDVEDIRGYMEDNENMGTLVPNSFFFGKAENGKHVVVVSANAKSDLLKKLRDLPDDTSVYVMDTDIEYSMADGWDYAADTGNVTTRGFGLSGDFKDDGLRYSMYFSLDGSYSESEGYNANRRGSWDKGAGSFQIRPLDYSRARESDRKLAVASMTALSRMGLDTDLADEVASRMHLQDKVPKEGVNLRLTESTLYTPDGDMGDSFVVDEDIQQRISDAREEMERMLPIMDARLREEMEQQRQWEEDMARPYEEEPYDYYGYDDDDRYGGRRTKRHAKAATRGRRHRSSRRTTRRKSRR